MKVGVIGGGAAGFFAAINIKYMHPSYDVEILEKTTNLLSKVRISGGGRCNVTNSCPNHKVLLEGYPRGKVLLKKALKVFDNRDTVDWFESRGVSLKTEEDGRIFPVSNLSQSIIDCFMKEIAQFDINIRTKTAVKSINISESNTIELSIRTNNQLERVQYEKVIVATGGSPKIVGFDWIADLGHAIMNPVPSLFTFNMPQESIRSLMGVVAQKASIRIASSKLSATGPILITHWGMSGPAVLKLSSLAAVYLHENNYRFTVFINWIAQKNQELVLQFLMDIINQHPKKKLINIKPFDIPGRLWEYLLNKVDIPQDRKWHELGKKNIHKIIRIVTNDAYQVHGKTTFKEEFVTSGGVSLDDINHTSLSSKHNSNLYFAGEVLDIDGITGGYNFQAAWTTAYIASKLS